LPEGLRELLLARLHDLPDSALAVLRPASVLGQGFTEDLLGATTGLPLPEIEDALRQAVDHNILRFRLYHFDAAPTPASSGSSWTSRRRPGDWPRPQERAGEHEPRVVR
jgi:hypothetical protein